MSGLNGSLSIALSALSVSQQALATTSNNVANANTAGFSRQRPVLAAGDPVVVGSLTFGTGGVLQKIQSLRDPILEIQLNQQAQPQTHLLRQLSGLVYVAVIPTCQGIWLALSNGTTLVSGSQSFALPSQLGSDGVQHILAGSQDITGSLKGGSLAGLIQVRDQEIPGLGSSLDQLAAGLANALNTANKTGFDLNGNAGGNLFVPPPLGGGAATATLNASIPYPAPIAAS